MFIKKWIDIYVLAVMERIFFSGTGWHGNEFMSPCSSAVYYACATRWGISSSIQAPESARSAAATDHVGSNAVSSSRDLTSVVGGGCSMDRARSVWD